MGPKCVPAENGKEREKDLRMMTTSSEKIIFPDLFIIRKRASKTVPMTLKEVLVLNVQSGESMRESIRTCIYERSYLSSSDGVI